MGFWVVSVLGEKLLHNRRQFIVSCFKPWQVEAWSWAGGSWRRRGRPPWWRLEQPCHPLCMSRARMPITTSTSPTATTRRSWRPSSSASVSPTIIISIHHIHSWFVCIACLPWEQYLCLVGLTISGYNNLVPWASAFTNNNSTQEIRRWWFIKLTSPWSN